MDQYALTVLVPIRRDPGGGAPGPLLDLLAEIGKDPAENARLPMSRSDSTHFARFVVLTHDPARGPRLLFSSNHDGELLEYARELASALGSGLDAIFSYCDGYRPGAAKDGAALLNFLQAHALPSAAFYAACQGSSAREIHESTRLREGLDAKMLGPDRASTLEALKPLIPPTPPPPPTRPNAFLAWLGKKSGAAAEWLAGIRTAPPSRYSRMVVKPGLIGIEDLFIQNQMTVVSKTKPGGWPRLFTKLAFLLVSGQASRARGSLVGLTTIHFARWVVIDDGDWLMFESNYDGSWENYIDDFVDFAAVGMNVIWGTAVDFPRAGCEDIEAFKQIIRHYQVPTQVFYSAYPRSTVKNNLNDLGLARAIASRKPDESVRRFVTGVYGTTD